MRRTLIVTIAAIVALAVVTPAVAAGGTGIDTSQETVECEFPLTLTDATGEEVTLEESPERVVALQPSDAQTAYEIGAEENVVGMPVNEFTAYLDRGDETDVTADDGSVVTERVIDLEPDVVLAGNITSADQVAQLRDAGLTVYVFDEAESLDDVRENVRITGRLTDECEGAEETVGWMDERLEIIETAIEDEDRPLAYYALGDGYTPGNATFQDELLTTAGVENLGERAGLEGWQQISDEVVVEEDPEWIVYPSWAEAPPVSESVRETTAYREENFVEVDDNYVNQPAPRVVLAIEQITEAVHPDAYEEARDSLQGDDGSAENESEDASNESDGDDENETSNESDGAADEDDADGDEEDEDDSVPGFGAPIAVAAVLAAIGLLVRSRE